MLLNTLPSKHNIVSVDYRKTPSPSETHSPDQGEIYIIPLTRLRFCDMHQVKLPTQEESMDGEGLIINRAGIDWSLLPLGWGESPMATIGHLCGR